MRHVLVGKPNRIRRCAGVAFAVASAIVALAGAASAEPFYRWRDAAGHWHFSNRSEGVPPGAQEMTLRPLDTIQLPTAPDERPGSIESPTAPPVRPLTLPPRASGCAVADPSELIEAIRARLDAGDTSAPADLALFVGGVPVSYSSESVVQQLAGHGTDDIVASDQAAIAYPSSGACPRTPPLERYAVSAPIAPSLSGLCADYHRASSEIDSALARNADIARPFVLAANRPPERTVVQPEWVLEASAAQTAELAAEIDELNDGLTVAHEEIDRAAHAQGCW
jgi:hypothetical protein